MQRSAIVLVVDQLSASMLGPYGNTWFDTPNFNRLAAQSLLLENTVTDCPDLKTAYRSLWCDVHALGPAPQPAETIADKAAELGIDSLLMTDHPLDHLAVEANGFDRIIEIDPHSGGDGLALDKSDTQLARFFAQAIQLISKQQDAVFGWLHCQGLHGSWDAPFELRQRLADDEDPEPPEFVLPPCGRFDPSTGDPDELLGFQQAAGAQIALVDEFLGVLLDEVDRSAIADSVLFCLMSPRGFPLGEHQIVGDYAPTLNAESVDVPLMIRWPDRQHQAVRSHTLVYPRRACPILLDWLNQEPKSPTSPELDLSPFVTVLPDKKRELICAISDDSQALQTHAWKLIRTGQQYRLYVKPDDRWEVNDVSDRCPDIVTQLDLLLDEVVMRLSRGTDQPPIQLDEKLAFGLA